MAREEIVWEGSPSQVVNIVLYVVLGLLALTIIFAPVSAIVIAWKYFETKCRRYVVTNQRLKVSSGILSKRTDELEFYRVKDTRFEQPLTLRMFGLGNILLISSDATTPWSLIEAVPDAQELRERIRDLVEARRDEKRVRAVEME
jgi:uncharacterized membrane protein YdbT with pleckstrin-like domain